MASTDPNHNCPQSSTAVARTGINRFPPECLNFIFVRIPLQNLLPLRRVSTKWNSSIIYVCDRKSRLTLLPYSPAAPLGKSDFHLYWIDDLARYLVDRTENPYESVHFSIDQLTKESTFSLSQLFPKLTELRLHYDSRHLLLPYLAKLVSLFGHFSLSSVNLRVFSLTLSSNEPNFYSKKSDMLNALCQIASTITATRLAHLAQLDLCIEGDYLAYLSPYSTLDIDFKTQKYNDSLVLLKRFSLGYNSPCWDTKSTLTKLGSGLVSLSLNCHQYQDLPTLISMFDNVKFESTLTHFRLSLLFAESNLHFIQSIFGRFKALKFVQLQIVPPQMFRLTHRLNIYFDGLWIGPLSILSHLTELRLHDFNVARTASDSSLPLIKKLTLCKQDLIIPRRFAANQFCRTLATQFPNLEVLVLVCRPFRGQIDEGNRAREVEQQVRLNLNQFVHLRSTAFDFTALEWR